MTFSTLDRLECPRCGATHDASVRQGLCPACGSPLLARYDLGRGDQQPRGRVAGRAPDLWRYHELLPVGGAEHVVTLGEGMTPLLAAPRLGAELGLPRLLVKDDGLLPTGSFKARGAAVGVSRAQRARCTRGWPCRRTATPAPPGRRTPPGPGCIATRRDAGRRADHHPGRDRGRPAATCAWSTA